MKQEMSVLGIGIAKRVLRVVGMDERGVVLKSGDGNSYDFALLGSICILWNTP